jgi:hypothetical protein
MQIEKVEVIPFGVPIRKFIFMEFNYTSNRRLIIKIAFPNTNAMPRI